MKSTLSSIVALSVGSLAAAPAFAQVQVADSAVLASPGAAPAGESPAEGAPEGEAIVVTGIRAGLDRSLSVKRNADSVVDAISADDVGHYPDVNIAESVQRISGVQINRVRGEGRSVNIRGLPSNFTQTTLNGRVLPNASGDSAGSRTFDFSILPPEFVRTLSVFKSPTVDLDEGGLAGTVDVLTPRPFDIGKRVFSAAAQAEYETNSGKASPRLSAFYSDTFADDRLGISLGLSYNRRQPQTQSASVGYTTAKEGSGVAPGDLNGDGVIDKNLTVRFPNQVNYYQYDEDNQRLAGIASLQFRASDALTLSLDGFYTRLKVQAVTNEFLQIFANARNVVSAKTEVIDGLPTVTQMRVTDLDMRGGGRFEDRVSNTYSLVGGAHYDADGWTASLDGSYASSKQHLNNLNIADIATGEGEFISNPGDTLWSTNYYNGFDTARLDPNSYRVASINGSFDRHSSDRLWDIKGNVRREFGDEGLTAFQTGFHYSDRKIYQDNNSLTIQAAGVSNLYAALTGSPLGVGPIAGSYSAAPFMQLITAGKGSYLGSYGGSANFATSWLASDTRSFISNFSDDELIAAGTYTNDATGITDVRERTFAGYARGDFVFGQLSGNVGFRVVQTRQATVGVSPDLTAITVEPDAGNVTRVPASAPITVKRDYWDFLPALNLKWQATDDLLFRFSASRTMTRPNLSQISPTTTASGTARTITQNNPDLDPFRANNLDATVEWYFSKDALIGSSLFYKDLKSLIRNETTVQAVPVTFVYSNGTRVSSNLDFTVSRLVNGSGVTVKGFELYYQQAFRFLPAPLDGLGTVLNYTYIDNSDPTQLTGASKHNYNATAYYEKGPIGIRLSYSWRSGFLSTAAVAPAMSQYTRSYGTLDGSINLQLNDRFSLVLEAVNILDTDERIRYTNGLPQSYLDAGKRIFGGIRFAM
ncbi:TonB-dependent receptor [Novosphingobium sp. BL-8A]|uniref:TonB-dependent receptor n=1 Tax=Novosphingobium sp. BL-8A TaxID=3127639 RepID=UPI00375743F4